MGRSIATNVAALRNTRLTRRSTDRERPCEASDAWEDCTVSARVMLEREGTTLSCLDFGGQGDPVVLLHGLAGHAGEWTETASWLTEQHRVLAIDARGHGHSERSPADVSRAAHVADAVFVIEQLGLEAAAVVGQSLGGNTAILLAAAHPDRVSSLVVVEASAGSGTRSEAEHVVNATTRSLESWPVPFATWDDALAFWGGRSVKAQAWASGLEERAGGLWPRFEIPVMGRTLCEALSRTCWREWEGLTMETLLVRGSAGFMSREVAEAMTRRARSADLVDIPGAGHDVHLERPEEWRRVLTEFLES